MTSERAVVSSTFHGRDILSVFDLSNAAITELFNFARRMKPIADRRVRSQILSRYIMGSFFFKESTRTRLSGEFAFMRLGGNVVTFTDMKFSSIAKGESFEDTIATLDCYCDLMTLRLEHTGQAKIAADIATKPVVNAGDGSGEHPTQALLDVFTIEEAMNKDIRNEPWEIALVGDLKYGRTAHSLVQLLNFRCGAAVSFRLVSPKELKLPAEYLVDVDENRVLETTNFIEGIQNVDAIYMLRPQFERMENENEKAAWWEVAQQYRLTFSVYKKYCQSGALITHPGPRNKEISTDLDLFPNALYKKVQPENGNLIRMALYTFILGKDQKFV